MKLCIYTDVHWCATYSIVNGRGRTYSTRLEHLIDSVNWVQYLAQKTKCDKIICGGDFFNRSDINAEEITALNEVKWANIPQYFLVGNHEITSDDLSMNSLNVLSSIGKVISTCSSFDANGTEVFFLPYMDNDNIKPLKEYVETFGHKCDKRIIISHNDLKDVRYEGFLNTTGFSLKEIEENCNLFINGHIHNCGILNDKETIINLGNLCGQRFTEDAFAYRHYACVVDTDTLQVDYYENPYALNFYHLYIGDGLKIESELARLGANAVVSISTKVSLMEDIRQLLKEMPNIVNYKFSDTLNETTVDEETTDVELGRVNHLVKFREFCLNVIGDTPAVIQELNEVCK